MWLTQQHTKLKFKCILFYNKLFLLWSCVLFGQWFLILKDVSYSAGNKCRSAVITLLVIQIRHRSVESDYIA